MRSKSQHSGQSPPHLLTCRREIGEEATYVKSNINLAENDCEQSYGNQGGRSNANKHTKHEYRLFHLGAPL